MSISVRCNAVFVLIFFKTMYDKAIFKLGFCIQNNQGPGKCYQSQPLTKIITITWTLIIPDITKTSSNDYL